MSEEESDDYWDTETWCCLKHLLKAEANLKETVEKAKRSGDVFEPEGGEFRNFILAVENVEAAVGHYEEFASKGEEYYEPCSELMDDCRYLRQKLVNSVGKERKELFKCLRSLNEFITKHLKYMKGEGNEE